MSNVIKRGFKASELILDSIAFEKLCEEWEGKMSEGLRAWLAVWNSLDLAWSPMDDEQRKWIRTGHYKGWFTDRGLAQFADPKFPKEPSQSFLWEDLKDAYMGIAVRSNEPSTMVYDVQKAIKIIMKREKCDRERAIEILDDKLQSCENTVAPILINQCT